MIFVVRFQNRKRYELARGSIKVGNDDFRGKVSKP